jgi:hypothetical protein
VSDFESISRRKVVRPTLFSSAIAAMIIACGAVAASIAPAVAASRMVSVSAAGSAGPGVVRAAAAASPTVAGSNDYLNSNSCTSATFCMAVGAYNLGGHTPGLSEMLSGGSWVAEPVPSPSNGVNIFANEVSCASPVRCLFVGQRRAGRRGPGANLAEAWNGSSWQIVTATGPAGAAVSGLDDVACPPQSSASRPVSRERAAATKTRPTRGRTAPPGDR